jgi:hypothetical protein
MAIKRLLCVLSFLMCLSAYAADKDAEAHKLSYNRPGATCDLGWGLWGNPLPMDYDSDGDMDLFVSSAGVPSRGLCYFENDGSGAFKPGRVLDGEKRSNVGVSYVNGLPVVCEPGVVYDDFTRKLYAAPRKLPFDKKFHSDRDNQWRMADYDGDGVTDLLIGASDWREYGWDDAYDATGRWTAGPLHGFVYWVRNTGTEAAPVYGEAQQLMAGGKPVDVYGAPSPNLVDWDGDGDLDLLCGSFLDTITFFENTGTRTAPEYAAGRLLEVDGKPLHLELEMLQVVVVDWDRDGDPDIIVGKEDGRVVFVQNAGRFENGMPVLKAPVYLRQQADKVKCGALVTPDAADWDGDGDDDLICGNTAGFIEFLENLGGTPAAWAEPVRLKAGGEVVRIQAGPNLSIQGPAEAKWGYTVPVVADWDGDGLLDILCNSIVGKIVWFRNVGTARHPELAAEAPVRVAWDGVPPKPAWFWWTPGPEELVVEWRTKPIVADLNHDGLADLVAVDHEGFLALYERKQTDAGLTLTPGRRIFQGADQKDAVLDANGGPLRLDLNKDAINDLAQRGPDGAVLYRSSDRKTDRDAVRSAATVFGSGQDMPFVNSSGTEARWFRANGIWAGGSGRRQMILCDWDGDGQLDLVANSKSMSLFRNVGEKGSFVFRDEGPLTGAVLAGHTTCPTLADFDRDGVKELIVGAEDGFLYHYVRAETKKP